MLIRSKLIRKDGTMVTLGKGADARHYDFKPRDAAKPDEDHVCEVANKDDIATFLAIKEGYEVHEDKPAAPAPTAQQRAAVVDSGRQTSDQPSGSRPPGVTEGLTDRQKSASESASRTNEASARAQAEASANRDRPTEVNGDLSALGQAELLKRVEQKTGTKQNPATPRAKLIDMLKE